MILARRSPFVRLAHDFSPPVDFQLKRRRINDHALLYFKQGGGEFIIGSGAYEIAPGTVFVLQPDVPHSFTLTGGTARMFNLHFDLVERTDGGRIPFQRSFRARNPRHRLEMLGTNAKAADFLPVRLQLVSTASYERLFHTVLRASSLGGTAEQLALKAGMIELLALLFRETRAQAVSPRLARHMPQLERAGQFMAANLDRPVTLAEMACAAGLSRTLFAASFRAYHHQSPARFHLRQRIEQAATELIVGPRDIKDVADAHGFQTVHHFSRCFARQMGMPPAAYRAAHSIVADD